MNTESTTQENEDTATTEVKKGPGERLRNERESLGLSISEVATRLYLTNAMVLAIENDDYSMGRSMVFIRGYLRAYAKLLNIPQEEILIPFDSLKLQDAPAKLSTQEIYQRKVSYIEKLLPWLTGLIAFGLIVLVFMWWSSQNAAVEVKPTYDSGSKPAVINKPHKNIKPVEITPPAIIPNIKLQNLLILKQTVTSTPLTPEVPANEVPKPQIQQEPPIAPQQQLPLQTNNMSNDTSNIAPNNEANIPNESPAANNPDNNNESTNDNNVQNQPTLNVPKKKRKIFMKTPFS